MVIVESSVDQQPIGQASVRDDQRHLGSTDAQGTLVLRERPGGNLHFVADGFMPVSVPMVAATEDPLRVRLDPLQTIHGFVVDAETGARIVGAQVKAFQKDAHWASDVTDANGLFSLALGPTTECIVTVGANGYLGKRLVWEPPLTPSVLIELGDGAVLEGTVIEPSGTSVSGARVTWHSDRGTSLRTTTNEQGHFRMAGFGVPVNCFVQAEHKDYAPSAGQWLSLDETRAKQYVTLTIDQPDCILHCQVVDEHGIPYRAMGVSLRLVAGAEDTVLPEAMSATRTFDRCDEDGRVTLYPTPGAYHLECADASRPAHREFIELNTGEHQRLVVVPRGVKLTGRVFDPSGTPLRGQRVAVTLPSGRLRTATDKQGRFDFTGLLAGDPYELRVPVGQHSKFRQEVRSGVVGSGALDIVLSVGGTVRIKLLNAPSEPPQVFLLAPGVADDRVESVNYDEGVLEFQTGLGLDSFHLVLVADGAAPWTRFGLQMPRDGVLDLGSIELQKGKPLRGRVLDEAGRPVAATVEVQVGPVWHTVRRANTGDDGRFVLDHLLARNLQLSITADGYANVEERILRLPSEPVTFMLVKRGTILGQLPVTSPPSRIEIALRRLADPSEISSRLYRSELDGRFRIDHRAGQYRLFFRRFGSSYWVEGAVATVHAGQETLVNCAEIKLP